MTVLSKRKTVQRVIENPSTPIDIRLHLEDQWTGPALLAKVISGIIRAGLVAVFSTILVMFMINCFQMFQSISARTAFLTAIKVSLYAFSARTAFLTAEKASLYAFSAGATW